MGVEYKQYLLPKEHSFQPSPKQLGEHKKVRGLSHLDTWVPPLKDFLKVAI